MLRTLVCVLIACSLTAPGLSTSPPLPIKGDSLEWSSSAIGYELPEETEPVIAAGVVELAGAGAGIWGRTDEFYYLYTPLPDGGAFTARLWSFAPANEGSKAGVMLRNSLDPESANVMLYVSGTNSLFLQARTEEEAATTSAGQKVGLGANTWLRLGRWGDEVVGEYSSNGIDWYQLGRYTLDLSEGAYIGLAVTSHEPDEVVGAEFTDLKLRRGDMGSPSAPAEAESPADAGPDPPTDSMVGSSAQKESPASDAWVCGSQPLSPRFEPTLYVSTDGHDSSDGRSQDRAVRSLQRAANLASAGDVVWVRGGVYSASVSLRKQGNAAEPIVFESYPGECAVIEGTDHEANQLVQFDRASFYIFRNFEVRNSKGQGIHLRDSNDILVSHVRSHHNGLSGIQNVGGRDNRFTQFLVHDNSDGRKGDADGIGISSGHGMHIDHCAAFRNSDDGIDVWKSVGTIVEYCVAFENGFQGGDGIGIKAGGGLRNGDAVLRFNISFGNKSEGFTHNSGGGVTFENNTSFNNGIFGFRAAKNTLLNNISFDNGRSDFQDDGRNRQEANSWNLSLPAPRFASTDPRSASFLSLADGSGAIGSAAGSTGSEDLGAIPYGETIESFMGINLGQLLSQ